MKGSDDRDLAETMPRTLATRELGTGRLGTYSALGAVANAVPLPWLPDVVARRVRGALAHDVAARHGLSLMPEARRVLAEPNGVDGPRGLAGQAVHYAAGLLMARFGPLGLLNPVRGALETFVLGHLMDRYLATAREERSIRIDVQEARRLRSAIDQAMIAAITHESRGEGLAPAKASEDFRDHLTVLVDGLVIGAASLPAWLVRRLDAAFDDVLPRVHG